MCDKTCVVPLRKRTLNERLDYITMRYAILEERVKKLEEKDGVEL